MPQAESGVPSSVTPPTPRVSLCWGGEFGSGLHSLQHALHAVGRVSLLAPSAVDRRPQPLGNPPAPASTFGEVPFRCPLGQHLPYGQFMPPERHFVPLYAASAPSTIVLWAERHTAIPTPLPLTVIRACMHLRHPSPTPLRTIGVFRPVDSLDDSSAEDDFAPDFGNLGLEAESILIPQSHLLWRPYGLTFLLSVEILRPPQYFYGYMP